MMPLVSPVGPSRALPEEPRTGQQGAKRAIRCSTTGRRPAHAGRHFSSFVKAAAIRELCSLLM
jgi:hypothetical protein